MAIWGPEGQAQVAVLLGQVPHPCLPSSPLAATCPRRCSFPEHDRFSPLSSIKEKLMTQADRFSEEEVRAGFWGRSPALWRVFLGGAALPFSSPQPPSLFFRC